MVFKMLFWNWVLALLALSALADTANVCPDEFSSNGDFCYRFFNDRKSWEEAESYCNQFQDTDGIIAHLASIHNTEENEFISSLIAKGSGGVSSGTGPETWIGLKKQQSTFSWSDNTPVDYERWDPGEPNGSGYCTNTNQAGRRSNWDDTGCSFKSYPFVCKMPSATIGTPTFWTTFAGSQYRFYCDQTTWDDASAICASDSAHLVVINNSDENDFVSTLTASSTKKAGPPTWIGLKEKKPVSFEWSDGSDYAGSYDKLCCVNTNEGKRRGNWKNEDCSSKLAFVCEKNE